MALHGEWRKRKFGHPVKPRAERKGVRVLPAEAGTCGKKSYLDKGAAKLALRCVMPVRRHQKADGTLLPGKGEQSVYRCPTCKLWHLTSLPKNLGRR
jgi:hypothetical protein